MRTPPNESLSAALTASGAGPERTCVLSRAVRPKDELIRLALSPDGEVAPDVRARAPGRGAYVGVGRAALDEANAKGKLKGALARAFRLSVYPHLVLVDAHGQIRWVHQGRALDSTLRAAIADATRPAF